MNTAATAKIRLFFALWPDQASRAAFMRLQTKLHGRKTRPDNLHLTLAFLGEQTSAVLPLLHTLMLQMPRDPIRLTLDRIGYFPRHQIIWAGMDAIPEALSTLQCRLAQQLSEHGIAFDQGSGFQPHVTLARDAIPPKEFAFEAI